MGNTASNFTRNGTTYTYMDCTSDNDDQLKETIQSCFNLSKNSSPVQCAQFCNKFPEMLPWIYLGISCLSLVCCLIVFLSYYCFPRLRHSGKSTKIFLYRTIMDLLLAIGHIVSGPAHLAEATSQQHLNGCIAIGVLNQMILFGSNLWYVILAFDLLKAIRNPFSAHSTNGPVVHVLIWSLTLLSGIVLAILVIPMTPGGPGPSMFYWCWISVEPTTVGPGSDLGLQLQHFALAALVFYYAWLVFTWVFTFVSFVIGLFILRWRLATTSSETRRLVMRQNLLYVVWLGVETTAVIVVWIGQTIYTASKQDETKTSYFFTDSDFRLAVTFAIFHSFRGTVDLLAWVTALQVGVSDIKDLYKRFKERNRKDICRKTLETPLIKTKSGESSINKTLRRNAIYCINVGILDAVTLHMQYLTRIKRVGSVRDRFVAGQMIKLDEENQQLEQEELYRENPDHQEKSVRRLQFPATATIQSFSFIDLEPSIFSQLRTTFGVTPKRYRESFKIRNAQDIEKEGMLEKFTEGKSGSFFYYTRDYKYFIKTVTSEEEKFLQKIAYKYYHHMQNNPNSSLARFYGLHKVRLAREQRYITVIVMEYIFHNKESLKMHERYDLKGSWVGRRAIKGNRERNAYKGTLKDLDLKDKKIYVGPENKQLLMEQFTEDAQFLQSCGIMDYSLLLGIHNHTKFGERLVPRPTEQSIAGGNGEDFIDVSIRAQHRTPSTRTNGYGTDPDISPIKERKYGARKPISLEETETTLSTTTQWKAMGTPWFREDYGGLRSCSPLHPRCTEDGRPASAAIDGDTSHIPVSTYYFGIIDILQEYNLRKKFEHQWKTKVQCQDKHGLSAVNPKEYAQRFVDFMDQIFQ